ncbi:hypothetical protein MINT15_00990 [Saccharomonospora viridis]|uniref:Uncharacterized protein n=1 Tax=Saccharomonospora viridis TaxID=1852 RepID=A0A837DFN6_9PSEU|nr:hypothetical protein MINT15_00990 [Saccharomonospora viridis]
MGYRERRTPIMESAIDTEAYRGIPVSRADHHHTERARR